MDQNVDLIYWKPNRGKYTEEFIEKEAEALKEWMQKEDSFYLKSFAVHRGYAPSLLNHFAKKNRKFAEVYELVHDWQEQKLVTSALTNKINPSFTKFVLSNTSGWSDKTQVATDQKNPFHFILGKVDGTTKDLTASEDEADN